ncbi:hypothetical protein HK100_001682 [Physocladia obscura]|uniref:Xylanolytic transcriptional activator regulatory domain-containing protein n=1 Tax=Physocladia obscura TaxID=109957 RepID=A0AAD5SYG4_9FUNG|nr:hypothetical protein HK100_001682 [Physocladia obscura]
MASTGTGSIYQSNSEAAKKRRFAELAAVGGFSNTNYSGSNSDDDDENDNDDDDDEFSFAYRPSDMRQKKVHPIPTDHTQENLEIEPEPRQRKRIIRACDPCGFLRPSAPIVPKGRGRRGRKPGSTLSGAVSLRHSAVATPPSRQKTWASSPSSFQIRDLPPESRKAPHEVMPQFLSGGNVSETHIYKSIPRFVDGVLLAHVPNYKNSGEAENFIYNPALSDEHKTTLPIPPLSFNTPTPSGSVSTPIDAKSQANHRQASISQPLYENSSKKFKEIIPLPNDLLDHILRNFWEQFHPQFPLLDKTWFIMQLEILRSIQPSAINIDEHWRFILVLISVVALMINFTPSLSDWNRSESTTSTVSSESELDSSVDAALSFKDHDVVLKHLVDLYKRVLFDHFEFADIYMIQSLLIMVLMGGFQRGSRLTAVWGYMGMAVRMAQEVSVFSSFLFHYFQQISETIVQLGLHRSIAELGIRNHIFDRASLAERSRTWHCVMIIESYTCIWTGRPLAIHENDWDVEYPEVTSCELATLKNHIDLAQIIALILRFANRAKQVDVSAATTEIDLKLAEWWANLDDDWKNLIFQDRWNAKAMMALMYHGAIILYHSTSRNTVNTEICYASANAITTLVSRFETPVHPNECVALFPTFTYCAMLACTVNISQMLQHSTAEITSTTRGLVEAIGNLEKCMRVFDSLRGVFINAERCWKTILDFLGVKGIRLDDLIEAAKNGTDVAAAVAGMNDLGALSAGQEKGKFSSMQVGVSNTSQVEFIKTGNETLWSSNLTNGFINKAMLAQQDSVKVERVEITNLTPTQSQSQNSGNAQQRLNQRAINHLAQASNQIAQTSVSNLQVSNGVAFASNSTRNIGDAGFVWDGLSLFDLAGLGGLANTSFAMAQHNLQQVQQQQMAYSVNMHQFQNQLQSSLNLQTASGSNIQNSFVPNNLVEQGNMNYSNQIMSKMPDQMSLYHQQASFQQHQPQQQQQRNDFLQNQIVQQQQQQQIQSFIRNQSIREQPQPQQYQANPVDQLKLQQSHSSSFQYHVPGGGSGPYS